MLDENGGEAAVCSPANGACTSVTPSAASAAALRLGAVARRRGERVVDLVVLRRGAGADCSASSAMASVGSSGGLATLLAGSVGVAGCASVAKGAVTVRAARSVGGALGCCVVSVGLWWVTALGGGTEDECSPESGWIFVSDFDAGRLVVPCRSAGVCVAWRSGTLAGGAGGEVW